MWVISKFCSRVEHLGIFCKYIHAREDHMIYLFAKALFYLGFFLCPSLSVTWLKIILFFLLGSSSLWHFKSTNHHSAQFKQWCYLTASSMIFAVASGWSPKKLHLLSSFQQKMLPMYDNQKCMMTSISMDKITLISWHKTIYLIQLLKAENIPSNSQRKKSQQSALKIAASWLDLSQLKSRITVWRKINKNGVIHYLLKYLTRKNIK